MKLLDLFPPCFREDCEERGRMHKHCLPMQQQVLDSASKYIALVGGFGSGKTIACNILGHLLSTSIPGNMGMIARRSLPKLHDATERFYLEVLDRSGEEVHYREVRDGWPHRIIYANGSEVLFRETKDLGRFLGPEFGWFFLDEAQEEPEKTFKDLTGRLRLPRAARFLKGMIATNPPHHLHWIAKRFPQPGIWTTTETISGRAILTTWEMLRSSTRENPFLDPEYVAGLLQTHSPAEVKSIVEGFYGFGYEGKPVFTIFDFARHVGDFPPRLMTLVRSWDFGFHHPACTWHQMFRCKKRQMHWLVHHEYLGQDQTSETFAESRDPVSREMAGVLPETARLFPTIPRQLAYDVGDAAGAAISERGPGPIIRLARPRSQGGFELEFHYKKLADIDPGLDLIRTGLRTRCECGYYLLMLHRRCVYTIEAFAGGYHYPQEKPGKETRKPVKDGFYDNLVDTVRYAGENVYRAKLLDDGFLDDVEPSEMEGSYPAWSWMER